MNSNGTVTEFELVEIFLCYLKFVGFLETAYGHLMDNALN